jgi:hypothetical protein
MNKPLTADHFSLRALVRELPLDGNVPKMRAFPSPNYNLGR